jgi:hypothetical protein
MKRDSSSFFFFQTLFLSLSLFLFFLPAFTSLFSSSTHSRIYLPQTKTSKRIEQMSHSTEPIISTPTHLVSLTVVRKSDGQSINFVLDEKSHVHQLKNELKIRLPPRFEQGCRLIFREKVLKGKHSLKHYGIKKGVDDQAISSMYKLFNLFFIKHDRFSL